MGYMCRHSLARTESQHHCTPSLCLCDLRLLAAFHDRQVEPLRPTQQKGQGGPARVPCLALNNKNNSCANLIIWPLRHPRRHAPRCWWQDSGPWDRARPTSRLRTTKPLGALPHVGSRVCQCAEYSQSSHVSRPRARPDRPRCCALAHRVCMPCRVYGQWVSISSEQRTFSGSTRPTSRFAWSGCPGEPKSCRPSASGIACKGSKALGTLL